MLHYQHRGLDIANLNYILEEVQTSRVDVDKDVALGDFWFGDIVRSGLVSVASTARIVPGCTY